MTREEREKAINALKVSVPIMAMTQEEFNDYIQTLNKIMDLLEQETVSKESYDHEYFLRKELEVKIAKLEQEPFINKPCVSTGVCEHDKNKVLDKIKGEIIEKYWDCDICKWKIDYKPHYAIRGDINDILQILDKYKAEVELQKSEINEEKEKNPMKQTLDFLKNLYLQNKEEIDRVAKEYKVIEANKAESEE